MVFKYQTANEERSDMEIIFISPENACNVKGIEELEPLKVDAEPQLIQIISEPCLIYNKWGYQPIVRIKHKKRRREFILYLSPKTLSEKVEQMRIENNGQFIGLEFWVRKESYDKRARYIVEQF